MCTLRNSLLALLALACPAPALSASANSMLETSGPPLGFAEISGPRKVLVDVYFGGEKVAETMVETTPGALRFRTPSELIAKLPQIIVAPEVRSMLADDFPTNSSAVCAKSNAGACGLLSPGVVGLIYDEDHFRLDLFINPRFLKAVPAGAEGYLPIPSAGLSLTSALGIAASGSIGGRSVYNVQNRTVIALRNARIHTSNSFASGLGWVVDDVVGELDRKDMRYSAGLFWAPGNDFIGERRILGAGVGTQFDTAADRESLQGTPLVLFLAQPARVEMLVDDRLVSARSYAAGNNELDTSGLGDGSYSVLLRVHERSGGVREERRFFVKNAHAPPVGHPVYFAYAGLLANTRAHRPLSPSGTVFYQVSAAWRLRNALAVDVSAFGTQHNAIVQLGGWVIKRSARIRLAALASSSGDRGTLLQLSSNGHGPFNFNFDLRRIWSHNGKSLIPLPSNVGTFDSRQPAGVQLASGSYAQAIGSVGVRLGTGYFSILGSYRKDRDSRADYSIGPSVNMPLVTHNRVQVVFEASTQRTRTTIAGFAGLRMLYTSGGMSMMSRLGRSLEDERGDRHGATLRETGTLTAQYSGETAGGTLVTGQVGTDRDVHSSGIRAGGTMLGEFGNARAELIHNLKGGSGTQYDLSFQSGLALSPQAATLGARQAEQSAIIVSVRGDAPKAAFKVLVDDVPRGQVRAGQHLSLFLPSYRTYRVRLLPVDAAPVDYDTGARDVTLYPGNVAALVWKAESTFTLIAQAMSRGGSPITNALVQTRKAVAETDSNGYFQIDLRRDEAITITKDGAPACAVELPNLTADRDFAMVGKVLCL